MSTYLIIAISVAGIGLILVIFKLMKKGTKIAAKLPINFLTFFLIYAILGLTGFLLKEEVAQHPILIGLLLLLVSLTGGIIMTNRLYEKWEWSMASVFGRKLLYLSGIVLVSFVAFATVFLFCEQRGIPQGIFKNDLVWWLSGLILIMLLPLLLNHLHFLWNEIPKFREIIPVFELPIGTSPPFIESGGPAINFMFIIPLDYGAKEIVKSKVSVPFNKSLAEAFHYKLHEHNIVKRFAKKIIFAEDNKRAKVYGWCFYRTKTIWWGWWEKKYYLNPESNLGETISKGESIFVERVKIWEN